METTGGPASASWPYGCRRSLEARLGGGTAHAGDVTPPSPEPAEVHLVAAVLAGDASYDRLGPAEQAVVRAAWEARIEARRVSLDLAAEFRAAGLTWVEADASGNAVYCS